MIKKILVPYDNGVKAKLTLETAFEIAKGSQAEVCLLTSIKIPDYITSLVSPEMIKELEDQSRQKFTEILQEYEARYSQDGISISSVILNEHPGEGIVRYAEKENFDLIVMGSMNRRNIDRALQGLGSVSYYVLQNSTSPVLIM